jgi:hypothetical protein
MNKHSDAIGAHLNIKKRKFAWEFDGYKTKNIVIALKYGNNLGPIVLTLIKKEHY